METTNVLRLVVVATSLFVEHRAVVSRTMYTSALKVWQVNDALKTEFLRYLGSLSLLLPDWCRKFSDNNAVVDFGPEPDLKLNDLYKTKRYWNKSEYSLTIAGALGEGGFGSVALYVSRLTVAVSEAPFSH
jgi:hypothetical protein